MSTGLVRPEALRGVSGLAGEELAWGWPFDGPSTASERYRAPARGEPPAHPRAVLERLIRGALVAGPVIVSFSGGRDSSAMIALAVHVARRDGLPLPVPLTLSYPEDRDADEREWQELVVRHLGIRDRLVLDGTGVADALGAAATEVLSAVGHNVFPPGASTAGLRAAPARGGTLISGEPGDWVLGAHRMTIALHVVRGRVTKPAGWRAAGEAVAPRRVRRALAHRSAGDLPWLRPDVARRRRGQVADSVGAEPLRWDSAVRGLTHRRFFSLGYPTLTAVVRAYGAEPLDPLAEPAFLEAYAAWGGRRGVPSRTAAMRLLCGDLLPEPVLTRRTKASFNRQLFGARARAFVEEWDGTGVDPAIVDPDRLRREWSAERPDGRTLGLLQEAWLAAQTRPARTAA